ncbi:hypothetical protein ACFL59_04160 [Planctomycetota bacterium]
MPTMSLFGRLVEASDAWTDTTTYTFILQRNGAGSAASAPSPQVPLLIPGSSGQAEAFHPNLVVTREPLGGRTLDGYAQSQRQTLRTRLTMGKLIREENNATLAGLGARETELHIVLDHPLPQLSQWHAWIVREDFAYHFCGTALTGSYQDDLKEFRALVEAWG